MLVSKNGGRVIDCPRHANTPRQFECTRLITAEQVKQVVRKIPGFGVPSGGKPKRARTRADA
jgi:hypothetical protein